MKREPLIEQCDATKRVVIYARVSTSDQDARNQIPQLREYANNQGWRVVEELVDVASGSKSKDARRGLDNVFTLAHRRKFDILLFWALDRFSREGSRQTISYLTQLENYGVGWHSFTEPYLSTMGVFSDCIVSLLSSLAKQERIRIGERTRAGMEKARANGKRIGRPVTRPTLIQSAKQLRKQGLSFARIANQMGISRSRAHQLVHAD